MTQPRDPDVIIATWLDDGPVTLPDETRRAISVGLRTQPRARRLAILGGSSMSPLNRFVVAAAIVLAVGGLSAFVLSNRAGGSGGTPSPSASAAPSATPSPSPSPSIAPSPTASLPSTAGWVTFTSSQYGYQIAYPPTWDPDIQATRNWVLATDRLAPPASGMNGSADHFIGDGTGGTTAVTGLAADVPAGTSEDAWLAAYYADGAFCETLPVFLPITVDGHAGRLDPCYDAQAIVFIGTRVYVFAIHATDNQPLFSAFLSTVKFPSASPSSSPG